ncbi:MAG: DUF2703 domain-containing protein [Desulfitobacteriaceae bacterium]|nr:DUF2703 domain-containing protein [Desulfitobacteriaceae bacterium]
MTTNSCCCSGSNCCGPAPKKKVITIDFLYLDLNVCIPCQGTDSNLDEAIQKVSEVLQATDVEVIINKIHVTTEKQAEELKLLSSPTIRINGHDIQLELKESLCPSCGDLCGDNIDCRVWVYQEKEYAVPPQAMIIEAILNEVYGGKEAVPDNKPYVMPDNLKKFFAKMSSK